MAVGKKISDLSTVTTLASAYIEVEVSSTSKKFDASDLARLSAVNTFTANQLISTTSNSTLRLTSTSETTNQKHTLIRLGASGGFGISSATDAAPDTAVTNLFSGSRSGTTWSALTINAETITHNTTAAQVNITDSSHASGPYNQWNRSGTAFGFVGNGSNMGTGYTADHMAITGITAVAIGVVSAPGVRVDNSTTSGQTRLLVYDVDNATMERVTVGAADSGGSGYKVLRIPN